jgi:hypothetical protein
MLLVWRLGFSCCFGEGMALPSGLLNPTTTAVFGAFSGSATADVAVVPDMLLDALCCSAKTITAAGVLMPLMYCCLCPADLRLAVAHKTNKYR